MTDTSREAVEAPNFPQRIRVSHTHRPISDFDLYVHEPMMGRGAQYVREDLHRALLDRAEAAEAERDRLREALEPFSIFSGAIFAKNFNCSDVVAQVTGKNGRVEILAEAFFDARAALQEKPNE